MPGAAAVHRQASSKTAVPPSISASLNTIGGSPAQAPAGTPAIGSATSSPSWAAAQKRSRGMIARAGVGAGRLQLQRFVAARRQRQAPPRGRRIDGLTRVRFARRHLRLDRAPAAPIAERNFEHDAASLNGQRERLGHARLQIDRQAADRRRTRGR